MLSRRLLEQVRAAAVVMFFDLRSHSVFAWSLCLDAALDCYSSQDADCYQRSDAERFLVTSLATVQQEVTESRARYLKARPRFIPRARYLGI
jgi:hypothetical protein